jgi:hypothetical protein
VANTTRRLLAFDSSVGYPTELNSGDTAQAGLFQAIGVGGIGADLQGNRIINVASPQAASDAVPRSYIDAIAQGISTIPSVRALSTGNVTLSGTQTIDGVALVAGDRVLLVGQTNGTQNGVWIVASGSWTRPTVPDDYISGRNAQGCFCFVESEGTNYANEGWICTTTGGPVVDTTATKWTQFTAMGEIVAGSGLITSAINGNTVSIALAASNPGLAFVNNALSTLISGTGGLQSTSSGLAAFYNTSANTITSDSSGMRTLGVPAGFTLGGVATSANVTAANLATLTGGTSSYADPLHQHKLVLGSQTVAALVNINVAVNIGDPLYYTSTADTLGRADASSTSTSQVIGIAATAGAANSQILCIKRGIAAGVISGGTPGSAVYLAAGGGTTYTLPQSGSIVRLGTVNNPTSIDVLPVNIGQRSAS